MISTHKTIKKLFYFLLLMSFSTHIALAVAPSDDVIKKWKQDGVYNEKMAFLHDFHKRGGCSPVEQPLLKKRNSLSAGAEVDTVRVLVLMVDFSDHPADGQQISGTTVADFDSILFSENFHNPTGSMTDYYLENSYGNFYVKGEIYGWYRMPQTYAYYVNNQNGFGSYPMNAQRLTEDAILYADQFVDFSRYDFDSDGNCDGVILIHSGPGAETTSLDTDIWSHKWNLYQNTPKHLDGVDVNNYNINPEEYGTGGGTTLSPIGVFCHEYGHFLGLPDLYDTNPDHDFSSGLGSWSIMASGNYNGNSRIPSHFDPWCKNEIGFLSLIELTENLYNVEIPYVEKKPVAYKLSNGITGSQEYFIVENRQKKGFDAQLEGSGLLIYHVDETRLNNEDFLRYKVGLEQADNLNELAFAGSSGDNKDPYPGTTNNREFHQFSHPSSQLYNGFDSEISVWNISNSDTIMTADLDVNYSRPWIESIGVNPFVMSDTDSDGILEPGETVVFSFLIRNQMRHSQNIYATLSSDNPDLQFSQNDITISSPFNTGTITNPSNPIVFTIPDTLQPRIDSFFLTIRTDSLDESLNPIPGVNENYTKVFGFEFTLGEPNILIVDADRGDTHEVGMNNALYTKRIPSDIWHKDISGTPTINDLLPYDMVLWHTGVDVPSGAVDAADIAVMKQYMDNSKNLMLSTVQGIDDIMAIDSMFLRDYFNATRDGALKNPFFNGIDGNPVGSNLSLLTEGLYFYTLTALAPIGLGQPAFTLDGVPGGNGPAICGITYDGSYKSVLVSFAADLLESDIAELNTQADLIEKVVNFFGGVATAIYDGSPFDRLPTSFDLTQNYPNPFNPTTTIQYTIRPTEEIGAVTKLEVFNMMGQKVFTLVDQAQIPGNYEVQWDGTNSANNSVASGIYFYRLTRGSESSSKKMTLLK